MIKLNVFPNILLGLLLTLPSAKAQLETVSTDSNFLYTLKRTAFFNQSSADLLLDPIRFIPSENDSPDTPSWLHFVQSDALQDGYIYGTPSKEEDSSNIEIVAVNENTQQTSYQTLDIQVNPIEDIPRYIVEMRIININIDELFSSRGLKSVLSQIRRLWPNTEVDVVKVMSLRDHTKKRIPIPEGIGAEIPKDGVLIQFGGKDDFSIPLQRVEIEIKAENCQPGGDSKPQVLIDDYFSPQFEIDWCQYKMIVLDKKKENMDDFNSLLFLDEYPYNPPKFERRDLSTDFILTLVFPLALGMLFFIILSCLMFCGREGVEKRDNLTPRTQLLQYNSIKRATTNLRMMSNKRDGAPPINTSPLFSSQRSFSNTTPRRSQSPERRASNRSLPRQNPSTSQETPQAPPPYRLPPSYPATSESHM